MRKILIGLIIVMVLVGLPLFGGGQDEDADKKYTIGVVIPYEGGWFTAYHAGYALVAEGAGHEIVWAYHNYNMQEEATAIENLLARGVDAINVTSVSPESAEYSCRLANEEGVPIQITESGGFAEGGGQPFADIDFNWFDVYKTVADGLAKDVAGQKEVLWLQGFLGTPPVIQGIKGFEDRIAQLDDIVLATDVQDGQYATAPSLDISKALIQSGLDFNVAIGACQEITDGIIQALNEENVPRDDVITVSVNGGPIDIENFNNGTLDYCLSLSPGLHGMINAANLLAYLNGDTYQKHSYSPIIWTTKDDWQEKLIPWDVDMTWMPVVDHFVKTGEYKPELKS